VSTTETPTRSKHTYLWIALAALLALGGTSTAVIAASTVGDTAHQQSRRAFTTSAEEITSTLQLAILHEEDLVVSIASYSLSNPAASNTDFHAWTLSMRALDRYPGLQAFGTTIVLEPSQIPAFAARIVADPEHLPLGPDGTFQVVPPGVRQYYCLPNVGQDRGGALDIPADYDFCAGENGVALLGARDSGQGIYKPLNTGNGNSLAITAPVYRGGNTPKTVEARRAAFAGWVGTVSTPTALLDRAVQSHPGAAVSMRYRAGVSDVTFDSSAAPAKDGESMVIDLRNGWSVTTFGTVAAGGVFASGASIGILASGVALSLLLAGLVLVLVTSRSRALRLVQERTAELRGAQAQLVDTARQAGMAEIATNVLHNVGNVLNSVNISASLARQKVQASRSAGLVKVAALIQEHAGDLGDFLTADARGKALPGYLDKLATTLASERDSIDQELQRLSKGVDHIKEIVAAQQSLAGVSGVIEPVHVSGLIEDALRMAGILDDDHITILLDVPEDPMLSLDKHRVLLILLNLISNATHAMKTNGARPRQLSVSSQLSPGQDVTITVSDNGEGVPLENLTQIFVHGFTTHADGHGFGLHSSAIAAREMGGALSLDTSDTGTGATFTLQIPLERELAPV